MTYASRNIEILYLINRPLCWEPQQLGIFSSTALCVYSIMALIATKWLVKLTCCQREGGRGRRGKDRRDVKNDEEEVAKRESKPMMQVKQCKSCVDGTEEELSWSRDDDGGKDEKSTRGRAKKSEIEVDVEEDEEGGERREGGREEREGGVRGGSNGDFMLLFASLLSCAAGAFSMGLTRESWMVWLCVVLGSLKLVPQPVLKSMMSKTVRSMPTSSSSSSSFSSSSSTPSSLPSTTSSPSAFGSLFAVVGIVESVVNLLVGSLFSLLYAETVHWFPGFVWFLIGGFFSLGLIVVAVLKRYC